MSRIGKLPVKLPAGVSVEVKAGTIQVKGPKGTLQRELPPAVGVTIEAGGVVIKRENDEREGRAMHGLARTLIRNMVQGVSEGFTRTIEIVGVGYKAEQKRDYIVFSLGFSHPIYYEVPAGVQAKLETPTKITLTASDRQTLGAAAAKIRSLRPPEPYKGKGVKYSDENIRRKEGKSGGRK
ncbi:50S ribosomal protein L6 [Myxococcota bacterium]|jgi:large subunit ribosomal protein L6|nr:50S ribosomal protein L6 [Myxococcota bacterium]